MINGPFRVPVFTIFVEGRPDKESRAWKDSLSRAAATQIKAPKIGPMGIEIELVFDTQSQNDRRSAYHCKRPDIDHFIYAILNAMTDGGVWSDDGRVSECHTIKRFTAFEEEKPGVRISVFYLNAAKRNPN